MKDEHPIEQLSALHDDALPVSERGPVETHLAGCAECRATLADLAALDAALASSPVPDPGPAYWARFADRVEARTRPAPEPARGYERLIGWLFSGGHFAWPRAVGALAACTLVLYVGLRGVRTDETILAPRREVPQLKAPEPEVAMPRADAAEQPPGTPSGSRQALPPAAATAPAPAPAPSATPPGFDDQRAGGATPQKAAGKGKEGRAIDAAKPTDTVADALADKDVAAAQEKQRYAAAPPAETSEAANLSQSAKRSDDVAPRAAAPPSTLPQGITPPDPLADMKFQSKSSATLQRKLDVSLLAPIDSVLATDARLWERRNAPDVRAQLGLLATTLAARRDDRRAIARARERLAWLVSTSTTPEERERWLAIERNLPPR